MFVLSACPRPRLHGSLSCWSGGNVLVRAVDLPWTTPHRSRRLRRSAFRGLAWHRKRYRLNAWRCTLIILPVLVLLSEIAVIERSRQNIRIVVVDLSSAVELVPVPLSIVGKFSRFIEESTVSIHLVVLPLALIVASISVIEDSLSVTLSVFLEAFVDAAVLEILLAVFALLVRLHVGLEGLFLGRGLLRDGQVADWLELSAMNHGSSAFLSCSFLSTILITEAIQHVFPFL